MNEAETPNPDLLAMIDRDREGILRELALPVREGQTFVAFYRNEPYLSYARTGALPVPAEKPAFDPLAANALAVESFANQHRPPDTIGRTDLIVAIDSPTRSTVSTYDDPLPPDASRWHQNIYPESRVTIEIQEEEEDDE